MSKKSFFDKPPLSIQSQISLLQERNLIIDDFDETKHYLSTIGYYRLMGYSGHFLINIDGKLAFKNAGFSDILDLYIFDRELRLLVGDALERIEVALRTAISNVMSVKYGSHWYADGALFNNQHYHMAFMEEVKEHLRRSREDFIQDYYQSYDSPTHPPSWMVMECLSFGTVSKMYSNIKDRSARKAVGDILGQYSEIIKSWMKALTYTRNLCAHHSRLWNRFFINKPQGVTITNMPQSKQSPFMMQACIIIQLMNKIAPHHHWKDRLFKLFEAHKKVPYQTMGFSIDWKSDQIWKI